LTAAGPWAHIALMSRRKIGCVGAIAAGAILAAPAGGGTLTASRDWAYALAVQRDGKLVAAGLTRAPGPDSLALSRYTTKGRLDAGFGNRGRVVAPGIGAANAVAIQADGKILSAGWMFAGNKPTGSLIRYGAGGQIDHSFGQGGKVVTGSVNAIAVQKDGRIIIAGRSLFRYTARGVLDSSFGHGGKVPSSFDAVVIQSDGKIVAVTSGGVVARYTARGTRDRTFRTRVVDIDVARRAVALSQDGKIILAGQMGDWDSADFAVARLTTNGELDPTFGHEGKVVLDFTPKSNCAGCMKNEDVAYAVAVQGDGKIVAAGSSDLQGLCDDNGHSCDIFALVRLNDDGSLDRSFGRGGKVLTQFVLRSGERSSSIAQSMVIQRDGKIVAAGLGNGYDFALARYTTSGRLDPTFGRGGKVLTDFGSG
jgi:uncharacterized delta-60 repeat protein